MVYEKQFPLCPYRGSGNYSKKCSHKGCKRCNYIQKPEKCEMFREWVKLKKDDCEAPMEELGVSHD